MTRRYFGTHGCATLVLIATMAGAPMTSTLSAQGKCSSVQGKWWNSETYRQCLGLTLEQSQQLERIFQDTLPNLRAAKAELDRQEGRFSEVLNRDGATEPEIMVAINRLEAARSELGKIRGLQLYRMRRVLTPDQRAKLEADHQRNQKERSHAGPGGPPPFDRGRPGPR